MLRTKVVCPKCSEVMRLQVRRESGLAEERFEQSVTCDCCGQISVWEIETVIYHVVGELVRFEEEPVPEGG